MFAFSCFILFLVFAVATVIALCAFLVDVFSEDELVAAARENSIQDMIDNNIRR